MGIQWVSEKKKNLSGVVGQGKRIGFDLTVDGFLFLQAFVWTPHFWLLCVSHLKGETHFFVLCWKTILKKNGLESPLIFVFILKGKTK